MNGIYQPKVVFPLLLSGFLFACSSPEPAAVPEQKPVNEVASVIEAEEAPVEPVAPPKVERAARATPKPAAPRSSTPPAATPAATRATNPPDSEAKIPVTLPEPNSIPAPPPYAAPPPPPPPPKPVVTAREVTIPAGRQISVRMIDAVDSKTARIGDTFQASIDTPVTVGQDVVLPRGGDVILKLVQASSAGTLRGKSELHLELDRVVVNGREYSVRSDTYTAEGADKGKSTVRNTAVGAAIGAAIGAIKGGPKGAAIGAGAGAGGGVATSAILKGDQVRIASEERLVFELENDLQVTIKVKPEEIDSTLDDDASPSEPVRLGTRESTGRIRGR